MLSRLKSSSLGSVLSFTCFRYSPVFPTKFLLSFHRSHRPSLLRLDSKQTPCSPVYIMSYRGYARYPPDPTSRPPHAGLELLLGAAEHLESASQLPEQDTRLSSLRHTTSARRSIDGVSSKSPRDGHPFTRSPETSRFMQCSDSYDPSESDKVHSSASMPFRTRTRRQRQSEQNKSSSWPGTSSSSSTADLDLFIPAQCSPSSPTSELPALDSTLEDRLEQRNKLNPSSSSSSSTTTTRPPFKRAQTAVSCIRCRNTHKKCDEQRPCKRCVRVGRGDCEDAPPRGLNLKTPSPDPKQRELFEDLDDIDAPFLYYSRTPEITSFASNSHPFLSAKTYSSNNS